MRIAFELLALPLKLEENRISVIIIENRPFFRQFLSALLAEHTDEAGIVFSVDFEPLKFKGNITVIDNYNNLELSSGFIKKIYENMELFCFNELLEETFSLKKEIISFTDLLLSCYDYDFLCKNDVSLTELFKIQNIKPNIKSSQLLENILEYILLIQKYAPQKLFILINLHAYFSNDELNAFFYEITLRNIRILCIESCNFEKTDFEDVTIIDEDLCVI